MITVEAMDGRPYLGSKILVNISPTEIGGKVEGKVVTLTTDSNLAPDNCELDWFNLDLNP